jgi:hypothetical protein
VVPTGFLHENGSETYKVSAGAGCINIRYRITTQDQLMEIFEMTGILEPPRSSVTMHSGLRRLGKMFY